MQRGERSTLADSSRLTSPARVRSTRRGRLPRIRSATAIPRASWRARASAERISRPTCRSCSAVHLPISTSEQEQWIRDQLDSGNDLVWCSVLVTARPNDPRLLAEGFASIGAVSCANRADFDRLVADSGLEDEALSHLNEKLASVQSALRSRR